MLTRHYKFISILFLVFITGFYIGIWWPENLAIPIQDIHEIRLKENFRFINPLLECDSNIGSYKIPNDIKDQVENYISLKKLSGDIYTAAVYYRNLNNGPWFGIEEDTLFSPASLTKVPMMLIYYKLAEEDPTILNKELEVNVPLDVSLETTFIDPKISLDSNRKYTVSELIEHMIIYSDNQAYTILKNNISQNDFEHMFNDFGIDINSRANSGNDNVLTIREYTSFFRILYNASYLNREHSEKALDLLSRSNFNAGLVAGVPAGVPVSHKFGERFYEDTKEKQFHDCGIVYMPNSPYLICVMTKGNNFEEMTEVISGISEKVYTLVEADLANIK